MYNVSVQHLLLYEGFVMNNEIRQYLLTVICAASTCAVVLRFFDSNTRFKPIITFICGLFMVITVLTPLRNFRIGDLSGITRDFRLDANTIIDAGIQEANISKNKIICESVETYILDEAKQLGVNLEIHISTDDDCTPNCVRISGQVSPYIRSKLQQIISDDIGIPPEAQIWE